MASIEQNLAHWNRDYDWSNRGDEWSAWWGGVEAQWYATILPRIHCFVPTHHILELAPGFGRWTQMLKRLCDRISLVDLSPRCIDACRARFREDTHIAYHQNDGRSLRMIDDGSVDFVFSFDSLVHVEADVLGEYVVQLGSKMSRNGVGLIHHSNLAQYADTPPASPAENFINEGWRAESMSAAMFEQHCTVAGLQCLSQELIPWGNTRRLTDCISLFTRVGSVWARPSRLLRNEEFMSEAAYSMRVLSGYMSPPDGPGERQE